MSIIFEQQASIILDFNLEEGEQSYVVSSRSNGDVFYEVDRQADSSMTIFRRPGQNTPFAVFERREVLPDKITFSGRNSKPLKEWLKMKSSSLVATLKENGKEYTWMKGNNGPLNLISSDTKKRIAYFHPKQRAVINGITTVTRPYITLHSEAEEIMDAVIVSVLVLEQNDRWMRRNDEWSVAKASAAGSAAMIGPVYSL